MAVLFRVINMVMTLKELGRRCKKYRIERGYYQIDVAKGTGYSIENISSFERGRNDNARILLWYFDKGMKLEYLFNRDDNNE